MIKLPPSGSISISHGIAMAALMLAPFASGQSTLEKAKSIPLQTIELHARAAEAKSGWQTDKEILQHSLYTLQQTIEELDRKIAESKALAATHLAGSQDATENLDQFRKGQEILEGRIDSLQAATLDLARYAPPPLSQKISPSLRTLEGAGSEADLSLKVQAVTSILINFIQFNQSYTDVRTLHEFPDGSSQEVRILYLGLAQGLAVNGDSSSAWILQPAPNQWQWHETASDTAAIAGAFSVLDREVAPQFTELPIRITTLNLSEQ